MAVDKLVDSTQLDADLTAVADAIRTKGGTSADLAFPADFVSAIGDISAGGYTLDEFVANTQATAISGDITINLSGNNLRGYALAYNKWITSVSAPNLTGTASEGFCFYYCTGLTSISFPKATGLGASIFRNCSGLTVVVLPSLVNVYSYNFGACTYLTALDLGNSAISESGGINANAFNGSSNLGVLILRQSTIRSLANVNAFTNTKFANGKAGGTLYVPSALVSSYQSASNWSTILGYGSGAQNQILAIEGSIYETQYADGTLIT